MQRITTTAEDGTSIALYRLADGRGPAVLLTHGTFSSHRACVGLAQHLATRGFSSWIFDWRGHGNSGQSPRGFSFDDVASLDIAAAIAAVRLNTEDGKVIFIGHSGGGLAAAMWMARNLELAKQSIHALVLLCAQARMAAARWSSCLAVRTLHLLTYLSPTIYGKALGVGPEPESARLMRQWCAWNLRREFVGLDGFDYAQSLALVDCPILALAATADRLIAPPMGCEDFLRLFGGNRKTLMLCGRQNGFLEDYTHARLLLSRNASREIWPLLERWIHAQHQS